MSQPKPTKPDPSDDDGNDYLKWIIAALVVLAVLGTLFTGRAYAQTPTPTPTSPATPAATPTASATATPTATPVPSPTTTLPPLCGSNCFNPTAFSIDRADSTWVVVNKLRPLNPVTYKPKLDRTINLTVDAANAFRKLRADVAAAKLGTLCLNSGYRSFKTQTNTYANALRLYGKKTADALAAKPGHSEHQTGLAADVSTTALGCRIANFGASRASAWIERNAHNYGFIVRYPRNMQAITGYQHEPWHLRFVGTELAKEMNRTKVLTLEQFWQLPPAPNYKN
ncbi:MAG: hypothetical protein RIR24_589 [Actinomycetota bacterium]